jgi:hypothetical protein
MKALIDSGAEENLIDRGVIGTHKQRYYFDNSPQLVTIDEQPLPSYGSCSIFLRIRDSAGVTRTQRHRFVITDLPDNFSLARELLSGLHLT